MINKSRVTITVDTITNESIDIICKNFGLSKSSWINLVLKKEVEKELNKKLSVEQIARITYNACKDFQKECKETNFNQVDWKDTTDELRQNCIDSVKFVIDNTDKSNLEKLLHENWCKIKKQQGWKYGKKRNVEKKTHPFIVSYEKLPQTQILEYRMFISMVKSMR